MGKHFRYGGSTAKRTLKCCGWVALAKQLEAQKRISPNKSSVYADRGTMLHEACEILIKDNLEFDDLLARNISYNGIELTTELIDTKVLPAIEALDELMDKYEATSITTEEFIEFSELIGGTIDITGEAEHTLIFADYKFGEGILIFAEDNDQLLFYAWTKIVTTDFSKPLSEYKKIVLAIIQPADSREEPLDVWEVTMQDVIEFGKRFLAAVDIAEAAKPGQELCTGDHCQFCPASGLGDCPAKEQEAHHAIVQLQKLDDTYPVNNKFELLDDESKIPVLNLSQALELITKLEPWSKDVRSFACRQLELGAEVDGWKLVPKRATKKWANTDRTLKYLKRKLGAKNAVVPKLLSPAQAVKMAKVLKIPLRIDNHIDKVSSGTTLAKASDPRIAVKSQKVLADTLKLLDEE